jgi:hypothetical protein
MKQSKNQEGLLAYYSIHNICPGSSLGGCPKPNKFQLKIIISSISLQKRCYQQYEYILDFFEKKKTPHKYINLPSNLTSGDVLKYIKNNRQHNNPNVKILYI